MKVIFIKLCNKERILLKEKELQTGNPNELLIVDYFETANPYKLEKCYITIFGKIMN